MKAHCWNLEEMLSEELVLVDLFSQSPTKLCKCAVNNSDIGVNGRALMSNLLHIRAAILPPRSYSCCNITW